MAVFSMGGVDAVRKWVVADSRKVSGQPFVEAIGIGDTVVHGPDGQPGHPLRDALDMRSRHLLFRRMRSTLQGGSPREAIDEADEYGSDRFRVVVKPVQSPDGEVTVGVLGVAVPAGEPLPPEPVLGSWQWRVDPLTGMTVGWDGSQWSSSLHRFVYETTLEALAGADSLAGGWLARLIHDDDREDIKFAVAEGIKKNNRDRHLLSYQIITGYGTDDPGTAYVQNSAAAYDDPDFPDAVMLRGFTRRIPHQVKTILIDLDPVPVGLVVASLLAHFDDRAVAMVDLLSESTFRTSPSWARAGLPEGYDRSFASLAHPEDRVRLVGHLAAVAVGTRGVEDPVTVQLRRTDGTWLNASLHAARIDVDAETSQYLTISFKVDA